MNLSKAKAINYPSTVLDWSAALWAGIISGMVAFILSIILPWIVINDPSLILRLMASLLLGPAVIADPQTALVPGVYVLAFLVHFTLSLLFAILIAFIFHRWGIVVAFIGGAIFGFVVYILNFSFFSILFPWLLPYGNWMLMTANILFGGLAGALYELLEDPRITDEKFLAAENSEDEIKTVTQAQTLHGEEQL